MKKMQVFNCNKCGLCCAHIGGVDYSGLDRGDGVCRFLKGNLCSIYEQRPLLCRVDESWEKIFSAQMSREDFYELNYKSCKALAGKFSVTDESNEYRENKFIERLCMNMTEKESYLQTLIYLANADGVITEEEIVSINKVGIANDIPSNRIVELVSQVKEGKTLAAILEGITEEKTKRTLLYELVMLCYADGDYSDEEQKAVYEIASLLRVSDSKVKEIEAFLHDDYVAFMNKLNKILEGK